MKVQNQEHPSLMDDVKALVKHVSATPVVGTRAESLPALGVERRLERRRKRTQLLVSNILDRFTY